jgi:eukaryotic-like serine/threonine-protein kinase
MAVLPSQSYPHPASYTTQPIGPIGPIGPGTGVYGAAAGYWDPNTTGIIPPGAIMLPPGGRERRGPVWPWALLGVLVAAAAIAALVIVLVKDHSPSVVQIHVPNVVGLTQEDAIATLGDNGLSYVPNDVPNSRKAGTVVSEVPGARTLVAKGSTVTINVSSGPAPPTSGQVPYVLGLGALAAKGRLRGAGFKVTTAKQPSSAVSKNSVISTNPAAGSTGPRGSNVVMTISTGPPPVVVPGVVGQTLQLAEFLLQKQGLFPKVVEQASSSAVGTVLAQSPSSGKAPKGSTVTLTVAKARAPVTLPRLVGMSETQASAVLGGLGLKPSAVIVVRHRNQSYNGLVISQSPAAHTAVPAGSTVTINVENYVAPIVPIVPTGPTGPTGAT